MAILLFLLLAVTIASSWIRLFGFGKHKEEGIIIDKMPLPFLARLYMHAVPVLASLIVAIVMALLNVMGWIWTLIPLVSGAVLIALPLQYTLTDRGMHRTFGVFRRWTEFAGVERSPGGARLKPLRKSAPARIWLSGSRGDDEFLQLIRTLIKNAYKGIPEIPMSPARVKTEDGPGSSRCEASHRLAAFQRTDPA